MYVLMHMHEMPELRYNATLVELTESINWNAQSVEIIAAFLIESIFRKELKHK